MDSGRGTSESPTTTSGHPSGEIRALAHLYQAVPTDAQVARDQVVRQVVVGRRERGQRQKAQHLRGARLAKRRLAFFLDKAKT